MLSIYHSLTIHVSNDRALVFLAVKSFVFAAQKETTLSLVLRISQKFFFFLSKFFKY